MTNMELSNPNVPATAVELMRPNSNKPNQEASSPLLANPLFSSSISSASKDSSFDGVANSTQYGSTSPHDVVTSISEHSTQSANFWRGAKTEHNMISTDDLYQNSAVNKSVSSNPQNSIFAPNVSIVSSPVSSLEFSSFRQYSHPQTENPKVPATIETFSRLVKQANVNIFGWPTEDQNQENKILDCRRKSPSSVTPFTQFDISNSRHSDELCRPPMGTYMPTAPGNHIVQPPAGENVDDQHNYTSVRNSAYDPMDPRTAGVFTNIVSKTGCEANSSFSQHKNIPYEFPSYISPGAFPFKIDCAERFHPLCAQIGEVNGHGPLDEMYELSHSQAVDFSERHAYPKLQATDSSLNAYGSRSRFPQETFGPPKSTSPSPLAHPFTHTPNYTLHSPYTNLTNEVSDDTLPLPWGTISGQIPFRSHPSPHLELSTARRRNATRESTATLKAWLQEHIKNPYPTKGEKIMLAIITKMTLTQVSTWFANARRRLKKENKMTWTPKHRGEETNDDDVDADMVASDEDFNTLDEDTSLTNTDSCQHEHSESDEKQAGSQRSKDQEFHSGVNETNINGNFVNADNTSSPMEHSHRLNRKRMLPAEFDSIYSRSSDRRSLPPYLMNEQYNLHAKTQTSHSPYPKWYQQDVRDTVFRGDLTKPENWSEQSMFQAQSKSDYFLNAVGQINTPSHPYDATFNLSEDPSHSVADQATKVQGKYQSSLESEGPQKTSLNLEHKSTTLWNPPSLNDPSGRPVARHSPDSNCFSLMHNFGQWKTGLPWAAETAPHQPLYPVDSMRLRYEEHFAKGSQSFYQKLCGMQNLALFQSAQDVAGGSPSQLSSLQELESVKRDSELQDTSTERRLVPEPFTYSPHKPSDSELSRFHSKYSLGSSASKSIDVDRFTPNLVPSWSDPSEVYSCEVMGHKSLKNSLANIPEDDTLTQVPSMNFSISSPSFSAHQASVTLNTQAASPGRNDLLPADSEGPSFTPNSVDKLQLSKNFPPYSTAVRLVAQTDAQFSL